MGTYERNKKGRGGGDIIKLITSISFTFLLHFHILKVKLKLNFKDLFNH